MKITTNKIWFGIFISVVLIDIIIIIALGAKHTLSYFVFTRKHLFIVPFMCGAAMMHFFMKKRLKFVTRLGLTRYLILGAFAVVALVLSFIISINPLIPFGIGLLTGGILWTQIKIKEN